MIQDFDRIRDLFFEARANAREVGDIPDRNEVEYREVQAFSAQDRVNNEYRMTRSIDLLLFSAANLWARPNNHKVKP